MPRPEASSDKQFISRRAGRVSAETLEKWALVRQIAELEEVLADAYHHSDFEPVHAWAEGTRRALAQKRAALRAM